MAAPQRLQRQLPPGVRDIFGPPAQALVRLSQTLRATFSRWGYQPVFPPTFEYYENVARAFDEGFAAEIYRFIDPDGHLLALRPDLTVPVARLVASKLYDQPRPQRMSYIAPVFRFSEPKGHGSRQMWQAGWELIGVPSPAADAEVLALLVTVLEELGLGEFQLNLGHMGLVRATLEEAAIPAPALARVLRAIDRKNRQILADELEMAGVTGPSRAVLEALPELWGGEAVFEQALELAPNPAACEAIHHLHAVYHLLDGYGVRERVTIDLGEVRGMDYYTGVTFELFASDYGYPLASGGRYDDLLARFGSDLPAVGAMLQLEPILRLLDRALLPGEQEGPDVLQQGCDHPACLRALRERRRAGQRVELDLLERHPAALHALAAERAIPEVVLCQQVVT